MVRNEICRILNNIEKGFNDADKKTQTKLVIERLNVMEKCLFDRKRFIKREEYCLSKRQDAVLKNLKEIFFRPYFCGFESDNMKDKMLLSDTYWHIYDFFYDYGNKDEFIYESEINAIYPFICIFKSNLDNLTNSYERGRNSLEFSLKIQSGAVLHERHPGYNSSRDLVCVNKYCNLGDIDNPYTYEQELVLQGQNKKLKDTQIKQIEGVTMKYLPKLIACSIKETYSFLCDKLADGVFNFIEIIVGQLNVRINVSISDTRIRNICQKFERKIYDIIA